MRYQFIDSSAAKILPSAQDLTPDQEKELIAQYIQQRLATGLDAEYEDIDAKLASGVPADEVLRELKRDLP